MPFTPRTPRPDQPRFERRLTEQERSLLLWLAVQTLVSQSSADEQTAADALDELAGDGKVEVFANETDAYVIACGSSITHAERDWLAFHAAQPTWNAPNAAGDDSPAA